MTCSLILDSELYQEIKTDEQLTRQALFTVLLVAIIEIFFYIEPDGGLIFTILNILGRFVKWCLWAFFIPCQSNISHFEPQFTHCAMHFRYMLGDWHVFAGIR